MKERYSFSSAVLCYKNDPMTGESFNIGVICMTRPLDQLGAESLITWKMFPKAAAFLSLVYKEFNAQFFAEVLSGWEEALKGIVSSGEIFSYAEDIAAKLIPDNGFSYQYRGASVGISSDPAEDAEHTFEMYCSAGKNDVRMVSV